MLCTPVKGPLKGPASKKVQMMPEIVDLRKFFKKVPPCSLLMKLNSHRTGKKDFLNLVKHSKIWSRNTSL